MKLLAIDSSNILMRHVLNPYGTGGAEGAIKQIRRTIIREAPTHLLLAKDVARHTLQRRTLDENYKAHREESDDKIKENFKILWEAATILNWHHESYEGYEADDLIASAADQFPGDTIILSGDTDLLALSNHKTTICLLRPGKELRMTPADVENFMGIKPTQIQDYKALVGDKSDGITGITGIGKKTAITLLKEYETLKNIYNQIEEGQTLTGVPNHITKKLTEGRNQARISWSLAGMKRNLTTDHTKWVYNHTNTQEKIVELQKIGITLTTPQTKQPTLDEIFDAL